MAIESKRVVAILLAAGRSERFGGDKMAAPFKGQPLAYHAARTLSAIDFARRIVVLGQTSVEFTHFGFDMVRPPTGSPLSASIASGVREAEANDCDACLIALADMPFVPEEHFRAMMRAHDDHVTATLSSERKMVPALFGRALYPVLEKLEGDRGASVMLAKAVSVAIDPLLVRDIDIPSDLGMANI